jgi:hypothetical protein
MKLSAQQKKLRDALHAEPDRGFDVPEMARVLGTSTHGATAASLERHGLATKFWGSVGRRRVHYQAANP